MRAFRLRSLILFAATTAVVAGCGGSSKPSNSTPFKPSATSPAGRSPGGTPTTPPASPTSSRTAAPSLPAGGPVPTGFQPASVTFVSPTMGYVLGEPASCVSPPCTSVVRTTDSGAHWVGVPAPRTTLNAAAELTGSNQPASVGTLRFADPFDGWAFGPGLWVTHDGARTWHSLDVSGAVLALAAGGGRVNAIVAICPTTTTCPGRPARLLSSPVESDAFTQVASGTTALSSPGSYGGATITLHPPAGFTFLGITDNAIPRGVIEATANGRSWTAFPDPCQVVPGGSLASVDAPDAASLVSLCTAQSTAGSSEKTIVVTRHGINTVVGHPPYAGNGGLIAANGFSTILVSSQSAQSLIYRSPDSGRNWTVQQFPGTGIGLRDLGFTTSSQAVMIHGEPVLSSAGPPPSELLMTTDAGAGWHHVNF